MSNKLLSTLLLMCIGICASATKLIFNGAELHKELKLEIFINDVSVGILSSRACFEVNITDHEKVVINSQAYNMIDAKTGPICQLELELNNKDEIVLEGKYSASHHFTVIDANQNCASVIDRTTTIPQVKEDACSKKVRFFAPQLQKDLKIQLEINGIKYPYFISNGLVLDLCTTTDELKIISQAYNQIDAIAGPPFQFEIKPSDDVTYVFVKYSKTEHFTLSNQTEFEKSKKKLKSTIEVTQK